MSSATTSNRDVTAALAALIGERAVSRLEASAGRDLAWALEQLLVLKTDGFYGKVALTFERGVIKHARREETFKAPA